MKEAGTDRRHRDRAPKPVRPILRSGAYMLSTARRLRPSVLWLCLALAAVGSLLSFAQLFVVPTLLSAIQDAVPVGQLLATIAAFAGALVLLSAAQSYFSTCAMFGRIDLRLSIGGILQNRSLTMSYPSTENQAVRRLMDKATMLVSSDGAPTQAIWNTCTDLLQGAVRFAVCLSLLATLHPLLIAAALVTTVASFFVSNHLNGWGWRHRDEEAEYSRRMNYLSDKSLDDTLAKDIHIFGMRGWLEDVYASTMRLMRRFTARGERVYIWGDLAEIVLTLMRNGVVYLFLIDAVLRGSLSAAQFVLYFNMVGVLTEGIGGLLGGLATLRKQCLDIAVIREFLDCPEPFLLEGGVPLTPDVGAPYQLALRDVSFRYPGAPQDTLTHVSLTVHAGEKLAVVGLNGAGKTTLIKLLCGFLDPTEGEVLLNGTDIRTLNRRDYYRHFSAVFQDFSLLDVTLAENVAQTADRIDGERVQRCVALAGLAQQFDSLPHGLDTHLGKVHADGIELSGGELQRLMLARALYKDAPILVLDEPTAALDPIAESEMYSKYDELTDGRTALYISHRLASTRFCDRIILLADSGIAEEGTHEALMAQGGQYAALFEMQSRYYREGGMRDAQESGV